MAGLCILVCGAANLSEIGLHAVSVKFSTKKEQ
jgi:hypothetical protein